ncbi:glycosyltransferase [Candidatus Pelagibacter ubique]|uniref:glycosyltransferase family 2 protein n=1 Tax=Pelagibacter ubique TaxID=198252 RepID=UPI0003C7F5AF
MLVSIIIPYYKNQFYIKKTVSSILKQSYQKFEIIIVNDEPGKLSKDILSSLKKKDKRIKIIHNLKNIGAGRSRNKAIKYAKGTYIAFIDSDDLWKKNKLKTQINIMKKFDYNISHTAYYIIDQNDNKLALRKSKNLNLKNLKNSCDVGLSTVVVKKKILKKDRLFSNFKTKEDYFLWLKIAHHGEIFYYIKHPLSYWRKTHNSLSSSIVQKLIDSYRLYYHFENNFIISIYRTVILSFNFLIKKKNDYRLL